MTNSRTFIFYQVMINYRDSDNRDAGRGTYNFYSTEAEAQKHCDAINKETEEVLRVEHHRKMRQYEARKAEHEACVTAGLREGPFSVEPPKFYGAAYKIGGYAYEVEGYAYVDQEDFCVLQAYKGPK